MHDTYQRLIQAAADLRGLRGPAAVGRFLGESEQTMSNWKRRGVPPAKHVQIAQRIGCDATWLATGEGAMRQQNAAPPTIPPDDQALLDALATISAAEPEEAELIRAKIKAMAARIKRTQRQIGESKTTKQTAA